MIHTYLSSISALNPTFLPAEAQRHPNHR